METTIEVTRPAGLTEEEARFAEAIVAGQAETPAAAARLAGKPANNARMWSSRALRRARVKAYLANLREAARSNALTKPPMVLPVAIPTVVGAQHASIADATDVLLKLTRILHSDIGSCFDVYDDPVLVDAEGKPLKRVTLSLERAVANGVTDLIEEVAIGKDGELKIKFAKKMDAIRTLVKVLGMEEASDRDKQKERAAMADALSKLPPDVLELLAKHSLGPARASGNGNGNGTHG